MCVTNTANRRPASLSLAPHLLAAASSSPSALSRRLCSGSSLLASRPAKHTTYVSTHRTVKPKQITGHAKPVSPPANQDGVSGRVDGAGGTPPTPANGSSPGLVAKLAETITTLPPLLAPTQLVHVTNDESPPKPKTKSKRKRKPQPPGKTAKMNDRHFVKHNYHDHAMDEDGDVTSHEGDEAKASHSSDEGAEQTCQRKRRGGVAVAFPIKLHTMLDRIEADGLAHVISWQPHGRAFIVHKPREFVDHVMPKYFRQTKITSFQRQLNLYGFSRLTRGPDNGAYYHELFLKGKPFLCKRMVRTKVKGTRFKAASSPDSEPDFYKMKPVVVTPQGSPPTSVADEEEHTEKVAEESTDADMTDAHMTEAVAAPVPPPPAVVSVPTSAPHPLAPHPNLPRAFSSSPTPLKVTPSSSWNTSVPSFLPSPIKRTSSDEEDSAPRHLYEPKAEKPCVLTFRSTPVAPNWPTANQMLGGKIKMEEGPPVVSTSAPSVLDPNSSLCRDTRRPSADLWKAVRSMLTSESDHDNTAEASALIAPAPIPWSPPRPSACKGKPNPKNECHASPWAPPEPSSLDTAGGCTNAPASPGVERVCGNDDVLGMAVEDFLLNPSPSNRRSSTNDAILDFVKMWDPEHTLDHNEENSSPPQGVEDDLQLGLLLEQILD